MLLKKGKQKKKKQEKIGAGEWLAHCHSFTENKKKKAGIHRGVETYPSSYCDGSSGGILFQIKSKIVDGLATTSLIPKLLLYSPK